MRVGLIRHAETESPGLGGRSAPPSTASDLDCSLVGRDEATGDPQQGRFPGPVLADERVNLARVTVDADVPKCLYRSERLGDALHGQNGVHEGLSTPRPTWRARQTTVGGVLIGLWEGGSRGEPAVPPV